MGWVPVDPLVPEASLASEPLPRYRRIEGPERVEVMVEAEVMVTATERPTGPRF